MAESAKAPVADVSPYLKQVRIRDYAPLRDAKVYFKPGLNIIIGPNGVGKTRFLTLTSQLTDWNDVPSVGVGCELMLGYDQDIKVSFQAPSTKDGEPDYRAGRLANLEVAVSYGSKKSIGNDLFEAGWNVGITSPALVLLYKTVLARHGTPLQRLPLVDVSATLIFNGTQMMRIEPEADLPAPAQWPLLLAAIFNTLSVSFNRWRRHQKADNLSLAISVEDTRGEIERITASYLEFLTPLLAAYSPIESVRLSSAYQVYYNAAQQETLAKGLVLEYCLAGSWLPFESLSDGTKRMLYLISQLVTPTAHYTNALALASMTFEWHNGSRIIFLEEPELGIHPDQLQKLLSLIREVSKEHQVIMTTHSPQVLNMLTTKELDRITICELDPEKGTQFRKLSPAKRAKAKAYMQTDSYLSDFWLYSNLEAE